MNPTTTKPKVFVGSSSEAKHVAEVFCTALTDEANMVPWWLSPEFRSGFGTLESLIRAVDDYDFGVFILTPDDRFESRGKNGWSARDNALFEFGLFLGTLGRLRTFVFLQDAREEGKGVKTPSDLLGIHIPRFTYKDEHDLISSVNAVLVNVKQAINRQGRRQYRGSLARSCEYDPLGPAFSMTVPALRVRQSPSRLAGKQLLVVARRLDEDVNLETLNTEARSSMARDWEDTFSRWAKPPGQTEQERIENAVNAVRKALDEDDRLLADTRVYVHGS